MAAYPALRRDPLSPDPEFSRRNPGVWVGGPIQRDRLFFFTNYEYTSQEGVVSFQPNLASASGLAGVFPNPYRGHLFSTRLDWTLTNKHTMFGRFSHDQNSGFGPSGAAVAAVELAAQRQPVGADGRRPHLRVQADAAQRLPLQLHLLAEPQPVRRRSDVRRLHRPRLPAAEHQRHERHGRQHLERDAGPRSVSLHVRRHDDVAERRASLPLRHRDRVRARHRLLGLLRSGVHVRVLARVHADARDSGRDAGGAVPDPADDDPHRSGSAEPAVRRRRRRRGRSGAAAAVQRRQGQGEQPLPLLRAGHLEGEAALHAQLRPGLELREHAGQSRSRQAGLSGAALRQRPEPDEEQLQQLVAVVRLRVDPRRREQDGRARRRGTLLGNRAAVAAVAGARGDRPDRQWPPAGPAHQLRQHLPRHHQSQHRRARPGRRGAAGERTGDQPDDRPVHADLQRSRSARCRRSSRRPI